MADVWSGLGLQPGGALGNDEWLYRLKGEVRGPLPRETLEAKLKSGELPLETPVAREGTEFHPVLRVAAFATAVREAQKLANKRAAAKRLKLGLLLGLVTVLVGSGVAYALMQQVESEKKAREAQVEAERKRLAEETERKAKALAEGPKLKLASLVSLGAESDVKIKGNPGGPKRAAVRRGPGNTSTEPPEMVQSCQLSQAQIFDTLKTHLRKINVCVEDEKTRDTQGLLPNSLTLDFVATPSGKVVDFAIDNRHYRTGPLNNCMVKAFTTIRFPESNGTNCPVSIPIKIGG